MNRLLVATLIALSSCQAELVPAAWKPEYAQLAPSILAPAGGH